MNQGQSVPGAGRVIYNGNLKGSSKKRKKLLLEIKSKE